MQEEIKKIIKEIFKCKHKNAILNSEEGYCPDCGKYVKKSYYIVRCNCCGIKRIAKKSFDEIIPQEKFCTNCGTQEYTVEKCTKLNIVDVNYAIEVKEAIDETLKEDDIEIWIEGADKKDNYSGLNNSADTQTHEPAKIPILQNRYITVDG